MPKFILIAAIPDDMLNPLGVIRIALKNQARLFASMDSKIQAEHLALIHESSRLARIDVDYKARPLDAERAFVKVVGVKP